LPGAMVLAALLVGTGWALWGRPAAGFLAAAFFIVLAPTSSIVPIKDLAFEHRMYLPLAAVIVLVVVTGRRAIAQFARYLASAERGQRRLGGVVVSLIALALGVTTFRRNAVYGDPVELWRQNMILTPDNPRVVNAYGYALYEKGQRDEAVAQFRRTIELDPRHAGAYANIATVYWNEHAAADSIPFFAKAIELSPDEFGAETYTCYGSALKITGRLDESIRVLSDAVSRDADYLAARYNLGNAYLAKGAWPDAVAMYQKVLARDAQHADAWVNLGLGLAGLGRNEEALDAYRAAVHAAGSSKSDVLFKAHYNGGTLLAKLGRMREARIEFAEALRISPDQPDARAAMQALPRE